MFADLQRDIVVLMALLGMVDNLGAGLVGPLISYWFFRRAKILGLYVLSFVLFCRSFLSRGTSACAPHGRRENNGLSPRACVLDLSVPSLSAQFLNSGGNDRRPLFPGLHGQSLEKPLHHRNRPAGGPRLSGRDYNSVAPRAGGCGPYALRLPHAVIFPNVPIFIGGFLQLFHDCVFYFLFRDVKPPEEEVARG